MNKYHYPKGFWQCDAFTLIELLVVVAIIAVLAAIGVINFLEAQVRAKVTRAKSDLRTVSTALEAYRVDANRYPPNDVARFSIIPLELTTPVAFLTSANLRDPFNKQAVHPIYGDLVNFYSYFKIVNYNDAVFDSANGKRPPDDAIDAPFFNRGALRKYGAWWLVCVGPDTEFRAGGPGPDVIYDPTNGTVSYGNISRTQKDASPGFFSP